MIVQFLIQCVELFFALGGEGSGDGYILVSAAGLAGVRNIVNGRMSLDNDAYRGGKRFTIVSHDFDGKGAGELEGDHHFIPNVDETFMSRLSSVHNGIWDNIAEASKCISIYPKPLPIR